MVNLVDLIPGIITFILGCTEYHIPSHELNTIFDTFCTTKEPGEGTGLGLSICYTLIEEHGGKIVAENSDEGVGFVIELPTTAATNAKGR